MSDYKVAFQLMISTAVAERERDRDDLEPRTSYRPDMGRQNFQAAVNDAQKAKPDEAVQLARKVAVLAREDRVLDDGERNAVGELAKNASGAAKAEYVAVLAMPRISAKAQQACAYAAAFAKSISAKRQAVKAISGQAQQLEKQRKDSGWRQSAVQSLKTTSDALARQLSYTELSGNREALPKLRMEAAEAKKAYLSAKESLDHELEQIKTREAQLRQQTSDRLREAVVEGMEATRYARICGES